MIVLSRKMYDLIDTVIEPALKIEWKALLQSVETYLDGMPLNKYYQIPEEIRVQMPLRELDKEKEFTGTPYYKAMKSVKTGNHGSTCIERKSLRANHVSPYDQPTIDLNTYRISREYFFCPKNLNNMLLMRNVNSALCTMSFEPYETHTQLPSISNPLEPGAVILIGGCGIGYNSFMFAQREEVERIVIVDNNPEAIQLYNDIFIPNTPHNDKIEVIEGEIIKYMQNHNLMGYNQIDLDTWSDTSDMIYPYISALLIEAKLITQYPGQKTPKITAWLEQNLYVDIQREILNDLVRLRKGGKKRKAFMPEMAVLSDYIIKSSDNIINSQESLNRFLSPENIKLKLIEFGITHPERLEAINKCVQHNLEMGQKTLTQFSRTVAVAREMGLTQEH